MIKSKKAVTLIEIVIVVAISALLLIVLMRLLTSGTKGATKGLAHQANLETAAVLMSQIENDLLKATFINDPPKEHKDSSARWKFYNDAANSKINEPATVTYTNSSNGITRQVETSDGKTQNHVFASSNEVDINFTHMIFTPAEPEWASLGATKLDSLGLLRHAMWVELTVATKKSNSALGTNLSEKEPVTLKKLIVVRNKI